jgi:transcriptional regulator GlxA family with amidase domain
MADTVGILALPDARIFDIAVAIEAFGADRSDRGLAPNTVRICAPEGLATASGGWALPAPQPVDRLAGCDIVIVPGSDAPPERFARHALEAAPALREAHAQGRTIVSLCTGAFALAASGLLDGREATTHWRSCALLQEAFPRVRVRSNVLYTMSDDVWTSAGVAAGIDACLAVIRRRQGAAAAKTVAQAMVTPLIRRGNQAQHIPAIRGDGRPAGIAHRVQHAVRASIGEPWTSASMAQAVGMAPRTLHRRFAAEIGMPPHQWLILERVDAARELLESTDLTIEAVAHRVGFAGADLLRKHFRAALDIAPTDYRRANRVGRHTEETKPHHH